MILSKKNQKNDYIINSSGIHVLYIYIYIYIYIYKEFIIHFFNLIIKINYLLLLLNLAFGVSENLHTQIYIKLETLSYLQTRDDRIISIYMICIKSFFYYYKLEKNDGVSSYQCSDIFL